MPSFSLVMDIDDNGIVLARFEGTFDASEWLRQRRTVFESRYEPADYDGRPSVVDMRNCRLPEREWASQFQGVGVAMKQRRSKPYRTALVLSDQPGGEHAAALFAACQKIYYNPDVETRAFADYKEAYAWALEALPPETPKAPENRGLREARNDGARGQRE